MSQIYEYQSVGQVAIFGDFNTRIGKNLDYFAGVDTIPERDILDFQTNQYCDTFIHFLISTNLCMFMGGIIKITILQVFRTEVLHW